MKVRFRKVDNLSEICIRSEQHSHRTLFAHSISIEAQVSVMPAFGRRADVQLKQNYLVVFLFFHCLINWRSKTGVSFLILLQSWALVSRLVNSAALAKKKFAAWVYY